MTDEKINTELLKFIQNTENYWIKISEAKSKAANKIDLSSRKLVDSWEKEGILEYTLRPLLDHISNAVKLAAASALLRTNSKEDAILVLRNLIKHDPALISPSAAAVLRFNQIT